ncbi:MAG: hypothetical protein AAGD13_22900 [Pseudomonadota bacterium]
MRFVIKEDRVRGAISVISRDRFDPDDINRLCEDLARLELYREGAPILNDVRNVDFNVSTRDVIRATRAPVLVPQGRSSRSGIMLVGSSLGFGMARVFTSLRECEHASFHVTLSEDEAKALWLDSRPVLETT